MKIMLVAMGLVEVMLLFSGITLCLPRSASYRATVTRVASDGSTQTVSESPWTPVSSQQMQAARGRTFPARIIVFSLLALNTVGIIYVVRGLK